MFAAPIHQSSRTPVRADAARSSIIDRKENHAHNRIWQSLATSSAILQRKCACGGECPTCKTEQSPGDDHQSGTLFRQTENSAPTAPANAQPEAAAATPDLQAVIAEVEQALSSATAYLSSKEPTPQELQVTAYLSERLQRLQAVAAGENDLLKAQTMESFSPERRSQAQEYLTAAKQPAADSSTPVNRQVQRKAIEGVLFRQPAPNLPPPAPAPPPPLRLVPPLPPTPVPPAAGPTVGATLLEILGAVGTAALVVITLGILIPGDTPVKPLPPQPQPPPPQPQAPPATQPQPQPGPKKDPQRDCMEQHPSALPCLSHVPLEEAAVDALMDRGYDFDDLGDCRKMSSFGPGVIDDCGGAPGESWHCRINGTADELSIFGCLCCDSDGSTGHEWTGAHISSAASRKP